MYPENRPLETLTAYAVTFVAGMLASAALGAYTSWVKMRALDDAVDLQARKLDASN